MSINQISQQINVVAIVGGNYILREVARFTWWQVTLIGVADISCNVYEILNGIVVNTVAYGPAPIIQHTVSAVCDTFLVEMVDLEEALIARFFGRN